MSIHSTGPSASFSRASFTPKSRRRWRVIRSLGLEARWHDVAAAYAEANRLFGDIVKVTPSSKVVGDMALMMVAQDLTATDVLEGARDIAFPASVVEMLRGDLGQPPGGWPPDIQARVLKGEAPITARPGSLLEEIDLSQERAQIEGRLKRKVDDRDFASALMYPKVFADLSRRGTSMARFGRCPPTHSSTE